MSLYFDLVICCDLKEATPESYINAIRCLTDRNYELNEKPQLIYPGEGNIWDGFSDYHFLAPDPEHEIISIFQKRPRFIIPAENNREVDHYSLQFSGRWLHDDYFYANHVMFVYWLATIVQDGLIGYSKESSRDGLNKLLYVKNGKLEYAHHNLPGA